MPKVMHSATESLKEKCVSLGCNLGSVMGRVKKVLK